MNSGPPFSELAAGWLLTYLLHSSVLLFACWCILRVTRPQSHGLVEWLWKTATVLPIATSILTIAAANQSWNVGIPLWTGAVDGNAAKSARAPYQHPSMRDADVPWRLAVSSTPWRLPSRPVARDAPNPTVRSLPEQQRATDSQGAPTRRMLLRPIAPRRQPTSASALVVVSSVVMASCFCWCALKFGLYWHGMQRMTRRCIEPRQGRARKVLDALLRRNGIQVPIRLLFSDSFRQPFVFGLTRPTIVLPKQAESELEDSELRALLAHEVGHLVRGDVVWLSIGAAVCSCLAIQPLNFLARRRWRESSEFLADDWAIHHGASSLALTRCLTTVAKWCSADKATSLGLTFSQSKRNILLRRAESLLSTGEKKRDFWSPPGVRQSFRISTCLLGLLAAFLGPHGIPTYAIETQTTEVHRRSMTELRIRWSAAKKQLQSLDAELVRLEQLLESSPAASQFGEFSERIEQRAASLRSRAERIDQQFSKEFE